MKKISKFLILSLLIVMLVGCTNDTGGRDVEVVTSEDLVKEESVENVTESTNDISTKDKVTNSNTAENLNENTTPSEGISTEEGKRIAFENAGVSEYEVSIVRIETDIDNGVQIYDIEFYKGNEEYDYEIRVSDGTILKMDRDIENYVVGANNTPIAQQGGNNSADIGASAKITAEEAEKIALDHAGISISDARLERTELDRDDGILQYEIEFNTSTKEYDYEIDANTGQILEYDVDNLD